MICTTHSLRLKCTFFQLIVSMLETKRCRLICFCDAWHHHYTLKQINYSKKTDVYKLDCIFAVCIIFAKQTFVSPCSLTHTHTLLPSWWACRSPCGHCVHSSAGTQGTLHAPECTVVPWSLGGRSRRRPRSPRGQNWPCSWSLDPGSCRIHCRSLVWSQWSISPRRTRSVFCHKIEIFFSPNT